MNMKSQTGFTIVEILITLSIISITFGLALPDFRMNKLELACSSIVAELEFASILAISKNYTLRVSKTEATVYKIHHDLNNNGIEDQGEKIQNRNLDSHFSGINLNFSNLITFKPNGMAQLSTITVSEQNNNNKKYIEVFWNGRVTSYDS